MSNQRRFPDGNWLGNDRVHRNADGSTSWIGEDKLYYDADGNPTWVGNNKVYYSAEGRPSWVGDEKVYYGADGKPAWIGNRKVYPATGYSDDMIERTASTIGSGIGWILGGLLEAVFNAATSKKPRETPYDEEEPIF